MNELKEKIVRARKVQEIVVDGAEEDNEKIYALGWLHCLDSVLTMIEVKS